MICALVGGIRQSAEYLEKLKSLPDFSFKTLDGNIFKSSSLKSGPVIIMYFHPECEHCQYEIDDLLKKLDELNTSKLIFISSAERDSIVAFSKNRINNLSC